MNTKKEAFFGILLGITSIIVGLVGFGLPSLLNCFFGGFILSTSVMTYKNLNK